MLKLPIRQAQLRWFAVRRLLTCAFFAVGLSGVAVLIVYWEYRMMLFALVAVFFALIAVAYGTRMFRVAVSAQTQTMELTPTTLTRLVDGVPKTEPIAGVRTYPSGLGVILPGGILIDVPIGSARMEETTAELVREGIAFEEMSGVVMTLLPVFGAILMFVVGAVLVRVLAVGGLAGVVEVARWSPWTAALLLGAAGVGGVVSVVWRLMTWWSDRDV